MITKLQGENFKRIKAVTIAPREKGATIIGGRNDQGKSSALDIVQAVVGGKKACPSEAIRRGESAATTLIETDKIKAVRTFKKGKNGEERTEVVVTDHNGARFSSPQALLDELWGPLTFDPLAFLRQDARAQAETLRRLVGLDFSGENAARQEAYDQRTEAGREIKRLQGAIDKLPAGDAVEEVSLADLTAELDAKLEINANNRRRRDQLEDLRALATRQKAKADDLRAQLEAAERAFEETSKKGRALAEEVKGLEECDVDAVRERIAKAEETNAAARAAKDRARLQSELDSKIDESERLSRRIAEIDGVKADAIKGARYPVGGLTVTDDGWALDGCPGDQVCQSGKLRVSTAIGLALNPGRALLVREGAFLDDEGLRLLDEMAEAAGAQVLVEVVGERDGVTVVIEDGEIKCR